MWLNSTIGKKTCGRKKYPGKVKGQEALKVKVEAVSPTGNFPQDFNNIPALP